MPGLVAAVLPDASRLEDVVDAMVGRMAYYPWLRPLRQVDVTNRVGFGAVVLDGFADRTVFSSSDRQQSIVFVGELFDTDRERRRLEHAGVRFETTADAEFLLRGWLADGPAFLATLNGEFAAVVWDAVRRNVHVIADRFGLRPLYMAEIPGGFAVASEIKSLLVVPGVETTWSEAGVSQFFSFGYFFNDDTLLKGVRTVPAATIGTYHLDSARYEERRYWQLRWQSVAGSPGELASELDGRLVAAVARRARPGERLGLSLSGGLDARTILGVMPAGLDLQTVSLGIEGSLDHRSASALAAIAGVRHHQHVLDTSFLSAFEEHLRQLVLVTDGHYVDQAIVMPTLPVYRQLGIDYLMRGHGGELLHMRKAYSFSLDDQALRASEPELERWLFSHLTAYMLEGVPDDLFAIDVRGAAREALRQALSKCRVVSRPVDRVWELFLNQRLHRETTLSMHLFGAFATVRQPYLDNDLVDALFSLPADMKLGDELQTGVLRRHCPAFLNVTNANTGAPLGAGHLQTSLAKLRLRVGAKLGVRGYQPYERLGLWLRRELRGLVSRVLIDEQFLDQSTPLRPDVVRRIVDEHFAKQANHTFLIMSLLIFALGKDIRRDQQGLGR